MSNGLPSYIAGATPNPMEKRAPWYKNTAPTYAGIFLWFVFWDSIAQGGDTLKSAGGTLAQGVGIAVLGLVLSAAICHYLFYLVPGLLGFRTGLPLYIVGTSTYGASGGFIMPGFLMGLLQFGWLGVSTFFSSMIIYNTFAAEAISPASAFPVAGHAVLCLIWAALAAFMGLKGIQYVARVNTYLPFIPLSILLILVFAALGGLGSFDPAKVEVVQKAANPQLKDSLDLFGVLALLITYVVGFFATAGAAGVDFGTNSRNRKDVQMGGLVGVGVAILFTAVCCVIIVAGAQGKDPGVLMTPTALMGSLVGPKVAKIFMLLLAVAAFPPACFSSFIAANSFKTTLPKVNPLVSVGLGALVSAILAVTAYAAKVIPVFVIIGASFGPICGAMMVDYFLAGKKWAGPRAGFNPAGWISWAIGFLVGILPNLGVNVPCAPVAAFIVGAVVYFICAKAKLESPVLPYEPAQKQLP